MNCLQIHCRRHRRNLDLSLGSQNHQLMSVNAALCHLTLYRPSPLVSNAPPL